MSMRKIFTLMLLSAISLLPLSNGYAQDLFNQEQDATFEKIYVSPDRVFIEVEGIFYLTEEGNIAPAKFVASDASGLYVALNAYQCPGCQRWNRDNICFNSRCPLYGK